MTVEDGTMPPPRDTFTPEMLRELLEEFRQGTHEVLNLANTVANIKLAVEDLTRAVRGGDGVHGLITQGALIEERLRGLDGQLTSLAKEGPPASQKELHTVATMAKANMDGLASVIARVVALEAVDRQRDQRTIARGWQLALFIVGQAVAVIVGVGAMLVAVFHK